MITRVKNAFSSVPMSFHQKLFDPRLSYETSRWPKKCQSDTPAAKSTCSA